jgi:hypothetical protein
LRCFQQVIGRWSHMLPPQNIRQRRPTNQWVVVYNDTKLLI